MRFHSTTAAGLSALIALSSTYAVARGQTCVFGWAEGFNMPGLNGTVHASVVFDDGTGDALYVAGDFTSADDALAANIAKWDGNNWSALGTGMNNSVHAITVFDDGTGPALYAGGWFTTAGGVSAIRIAKWDGANWSEVGTGMNSLVDALTVFDDGGGPALYAGGWFTTAGGVIVNRIAKWDGANWSALGTGMNGTVSALTVFDDGTGPALYAGGWFGTAGGENAHNIAKWDAGAWSTLGTGTGGSGFPPIGVVVLTVFDDGAGPALYAGGDFTTAGGVPGTAGIAKWDGANWSGLDTGMGGALPFVFSLAVFDDGGGPALYAGGAFSAAGGVIASRIAMWDGANWSGLQTGMNDMVETLTVFDDGRGPALYAGGEFTSAGGARAIKAAKWDGARWSSLGLLLGAGVNDRILTLTVFDDGGGPALYAGGGFSTAAGASIDTIAKWDGANWSELLNPMDGDVRVLTMFDDGGGQALYAGGTFTKAGGVPDTNQIAKWNGSVWSPLGTGMDGPVNALTVFDDGSGPALYAGGWFTTAGGVSANYIARWDGANWSAVGTGMNRAVFALTVFDGGGGPALYAGGDFTDAGGVPGTAGSAKWDGADWSSLGTGLNDFAFVLMVFDDGSGPALYAGGDFTTAGGASANRIAKWNGVNWSALGSGMDGRVLALTVFDEGAGPALYVGGAFSTAGGVTASGIARWNGADWSGLGMGLNSWASALMGFDAGGTPALYAGGGFTAAGGNASAHLGRWSEICPAPLTARYPHARRKNRFISFDPSKGFNDGVMVAFKVELKSIHMGSCDDGTGAQSGNVDFCRIDRGADDCRACSGSGASCITAPIDCPPGESCDPTGATCVNDVPNVGGTSAGWVWWVGPESPLGNGVHLMVSEPFRKVSTDWPNPTHVGDCEIVPEAVYGVRAVNVDTLAESDELLVETTRFASLSSSWWGDCVGPLKKFCGGDIRTPECASSAECTPPFTCDPAWTLPDGSVNFDDVNAALALVAPGPTSIAPDPTWVDLHGNATGTLGSQNFDPPNFVLNFSDIGQIISGFGGFPYKGYDPADCPDSSTWP